MSSLVTKAHAANGNNGTTANMVRAGLLGGIETKSVKHYCVSGKKIVEETSAGRYTISDCCYLDLPAVRRIHAVLGKILNDADPDGAAAAAELAALAELNKPAAF